MSAEDHEQRMRLETLRQIKEKHVRLAGGRLAGSLVTGDRVAAAVPDGAGQEPERPATVSRWRLDVSVPVLAVQAAGLLLLGLLVGIGLYVLVSIVFT